MTSNRGRIRLEATLTKGFIAPRNVQFSDLKSLFLQGVQGFSAYIGTNHLGRRTGGGRTFTEGIRNMKINSPTQLAIILGSAVLAFGQQPAPTVPMTNTPCDQAPKMSGGKPIVASTATDQENFTSLFNGKDLTGWWENCSRHAGNDATNGGLWVADPTQGILYSQQAAGGPGGMLSTNQSFGNYELIFDFWPTFGNDGGVFNRNTANGKNWQTTLDYITGSGVGGSFNENQWTSGTINEDPFRFNTTDKTPVTITSWTTFTSSQNPTSFGCSTGGCTAADLSKVWDFEGWNQFRLKFYDGLVAGRSVTMESWIRKLTNPPSPWVPVYKSTRAVPTPANPIALQIHEGTGRWKSGTKNLYRNIKIRPLLDNGDPIPTANKYATSNQSSRLPGFAINSGILMGESVEDAEVFVRGLDGSVIERFHVAGGKFQHALTSEAQGILIVELRSKHGVDRMRLSRI